LTRFLGSYIVNHPKAPPQATQQGPVMTKPEMESYRECLLALRRRLDGDISHLADEALRRGGKNGTNGNHAGMPIHMADIGSDNFEQEFTLSLLQNEELVLGEIADALERIRLGTFGRCEDCGSAIPRARLNALPYTRHCVACARKLEETK
jgi:RNA polymerase-binding transcription factor DksA